MKIQKRMEMLRDDKTMTNDHFEIPEAIFK
jgi:hypothetical protein